jgi:hypothetical protein
MAGDSVLAVFETATGAVSAALAIQQQLKSLAADVPEDRRMRFRIGVQLGDVIERPTGPRMDRHRASGSAMSAFIEQDFPRLREWAELAIQSNPAAPIRRVLVIAYAAEVGDAPLLRTHLEKLQSDAPDFILSLFRGDYRPFHRPEHMTMLLDSLRKAGLPD